jgi:dihydropteroate synthase
VSGRPPWLVRGREVDLSRRTLVMGVLNVTPDSFSDGGRFASPGDAVSTGLSMLADGADILDVGGESSRPGRAETVTAAEECARVLPVIEGIRREAPDALISIDTYKGETARRALDAGADIVNDIYALRRSPQIAELVAAHGAGLVLMHMQGDPESMQRTPRYGDLLVDIKGMLRERVDFANEHGVAGESIIVDPGIGFGKTAAHNLQILAGLEYLRLLQRPILVGASRKSFLGALSPNLPAGERLEASLAAACVAVLAGAAIVRVHDVRETRRALALVDAVREMQ